MFSLVFYFILSEIFTAFYDKLNFILKILFIIFRPIKIKQNVLGFLYYNYYNDMIKLLENFVLILLCWNKRYGICLILFFNLYELFPAFICSNNIGSLVNKLLRVKVFNHILVIFIFWGFNFILSAIVSSCSNFTSSSKPRGYRFI